MRPLYVLVLSGILMIIASILWIDVPMAYFIDALETPGMHRLASFLENAGKSHWALGYCLLISIIAWRSRKDWAHRHVVLFSAIALSGLIGIAIKLLVCRSRPPLLIDEHIFTAIPFGFSTEFLWQSFPSGHSTTGLSIALAGSYALPRLKWLLWPLGISIALARIVLNAHYVSDVLAGALLGILISVVCINYHRRRVERRKLLTAMRPGMIEPRL